MRKVSLTNRQYFSIFKIKIQANAYKSEASSFFLTFQFIHFNNKKKKMQKNILISILIILIGIYFFTSVIFVTCINLTLTFQYKYIKVFANLHTQSL